MNKIITILLVFVSCLALGQGATPNLRATMAGYWKMETTSFLDEKQLNDGTNNGVSIVTGKVGNAGDFDGGTDYVTFGYVPAFSFTDGAGNDTPFSISLWFKSDNVTSNKGLITKSQVGSTEWQLIIKGSTSDILFRLLDATGGFIDRTSSTTLSTATWYHLVVVYDASETNTGLDIYLDSSLDNGVTGGSGYVGMTDKTDPIDLGTWSRANYYDGIIDEVMIYKRELGTLEIKQLYNSGNGLLYVYENFKNGKISFQEYLTYYLNYINYNS